jgi:hypothetical protein
VRISWRRHLGLLLAYLLLSILMTWPLAPQAGAILGGGLDPLLQSWVLAWDAHALLAAPAQIWHAPIFFPYPETLAYTDHHLLLAGLVAPIQWATGNPALAHNLLVILSYALSGYAVCLLAEDLWAEPASPRPQPTSYRLSSLLAGMAFAFCAFRMAQFVHLQMLQTAWLPLALLFLRRALRAGGWRDALLCGLLFAIQCATALYFSYMAALALALYVGVWLLGALAWRRAGRLPWPALLRLAAGAGVAALALIPLTLPYLRAYQSLGIVRSAQELENWSAPLQAYLAVDPGNRLMGGAALMQASGGEFALFPGLVVSVFALAGLLWRSHPSPRSCWERGSADGVRDRIFLALLALAGFILSLGTVLRVTRGADPLPIPLPYGLLYERLPGFGALRVPARWGVLVALALSLLAGRGLLFAGERIVRALQPRRQLGRIGRSALAGCAALLILAESSTALPFAAAPDLRAAPPVYLWLSQPAQRDIQAILELPAGRTQRGGELERTMLRQYYGSLHWRPLVAGYSGLIPFGTTDLLGRAQGLPDMDAIHYLQLAGVDTLLLHGDQYAPDQLQRLVAGLDTSGAARRRAQLGAVIVYTLDPYAKRDIPLGATVLLTGDERAPGLPALALARHWQLGGAELYGPARTRYYAALRQPQPGQVFDYALLADAEDPELYGFTPGRQIWRAAGLALYARDPALRASLALGVVPAGRFHPASPAALDITIDATSIQIGGRTATWREPAAVALIELDVASLSAQQIETWAGPVDLQPGVATIQLAAPLGRALQVAGRSGETAILRVRVREATPEAPVAVIPSERLAVAAEARIEGNRLVVDVAAGGAGSLLIEVRGAAARDDKPILLLRGIQPTPPGGVGAWTFSTDLLHPSEAWLQEAGQAQDGRYQVYLKDPRSPEATGIPIAKFSVQAGQIIGAEPVPLPLTELR